MTLVFLILSLSLVCNSKRFTCAFPRGMLATLQLVLFPYVIHPDSANRGELWAGYASQSERTGRSQFRVSTRSCRARRVIRIIFRENSRRSGFNRDRAKARKDRHIVGAREPVVTQTGSSQL